MSAFENFPEKLLDDYLLGNISESDRQLLMAWYEQFSDEQVEVTTGHRTSKETVKSNIWNAVEARTGIRLKAKRRPGRSKRAVVITYGVAAAACVVMALVGWWAVGLLGHSTDPAAQQTTAGLVRPLAGHHGALLTLSNGAVVVLDSAGSGQVAVQGPAKVLLSNGSLRYKNAPHLRRKGVKIVMNKVSTPRGKQFSMVLPDGTKVWLNAASSISYPVPFADSSRNVVVTGEVYFEVAHLSAADHLSRIPFDVQSGDLNVKVLGTHFDIRNYMDEQQVKTTLLEGKVSIRYGVGGVERKMHPGQQATLNKSKPQAGVVLREVDTKRSIAWKDGLFNFKEQTLEDILKEVSRWYNVHATADPAKRKLRFSGVVSKRAQLADLLKVLSATGVVHFKINENEVYGY